MQTFPDPDAPAPAPPTDLLPSADPRRSRRLLIATLRAPWARVLTTTLIVLAALGLGVLSQTPVGNPVWAAFHSRAATGTPTPTLTPAPAQYTIGYVTNSLRTSSSASLQTVTANCGVVGQRIGGGFSLSVPFPGTSQAFYATASYPTGTDGWTAGTTSSGVTLSSYAVCLKTNFHVVVEE